MAMHIKKWGVKIGIRILQGLIALKKGLTFFLFILFVPVRFLGRLVWIMGGRRLLLLCIHLAQGVRLQKSPLHSPLALLFTFLLFITIVYTLVLPGGDTVFGTTKTDDLIEQTAPTTATTLEPTPFQAIEAPITLPGEEMLPVSLPTIAEGNALLTPTINTTRLENRLREAPEEYVVQEGDTLSDIAERFGISIETILWENKLTLRSIIRPGLTLTILPVSGLTHVVRRGETIASIAKRYKVEEQTIFEFNELASGTSLALNQKLIIPEGERPTAPVVFSPRTSIRLPSIPPPSRIASGVRLLVPLSYKRVSQWFTWRHSGIDMAADYGTAIRASQSGVVVQAGWGSGYGLYVLIDHGGGVMTRYAHNSKNYVSRGDRVERGQTIALVGSTGRSTGPHVHFETIVNGRFVNPLRYIKL